MYLIFDTETTGLPRDYQAPLDNFSNWPRLVQLAWNLYDADGGAWESYNYIIKPEGFVIPPEATKIHRISQEQALQKGIELKVVLNYFLHDVRQVSYLVAHNIDFDQKIIGSELLRVGLDNPLIDTKKICTMKKSVNYCRLPGRRGYKWPNLAELYNCLFQTSFPNAHDANADVQACAKCFFELKRKNII